MEDVLLPGKICDVKLLIVESDQKRIEFFSEMLTLHCFKNFQFVKDEIMAFRAVQDEPLIDMVILTPELAPAAKLEFCARLRAEPEYDNVRVMLQSRAADVARIRGAVAYIGIDLLSEPINQYNVMSWLKQMAENRMLLRDMRRYQEKMESELGQARQMQNMILPKAESILQIEDKYRIKISSYFETCDITGGDFWGVEPISRDHIGFYIVDCTGHGVTAALNTFRMHAVIKDIEDIEIKVNPDLFLSYLNKKMCGLFSPGQFATMFYGVIDTKNDMLTYSAAASTQPLLIRDQCLRIEKLECAGYLLGIQKNATYETHEVKYGRGDKILLYSDALIENIDLNGEMYGEERLVLSASKSPECKDGVNLLAKIMDGFRNYRIGPLADDLTVNVYARM